MAAGWWIWLSMALGLPGLVLLGWILRQPLMRAGRRWLADFRLWRACRAGDLRGAMRQLLRWRQLEGWPEMESEVRQALEVLDRSCYGSAARPSKPASCRWRLLRRLLRQGQRRKGSRAGRRALPPLWLLGDQKGEFRDSGRVVRRRRPRGAPSPPR